MNTGHTIIICMGSSCFARGNRRLLPMIEEFLVERGLKDLVEITGSRCEGRCADGPNLVIDGTRYPHVDEGMLLDLLENHFVKETGV